LASALYFWFSDLWFISWLHARVPYWRGSWVLGEGGLGEVWLGRKKSLKNKPSVQILLRQVRSLKGEVTLSRLSKEQVGEHPTIVRRVRRVDEPSLGSINSVALLSNRLGFGDRE
jgi:hypothetical protein